MLETSKMTLFGQLPLRVAAVQNDRRFRFGWSQFAGHAKNLPQAGADNGTPR
jgi:hypothetical protein